MRKNYTLRVEVWADGTYALEGGKPVALKDPNNSGRARTKPRILNVRVNVR